MSTGSYNGLEALRISLWGLRTEDAKLVASLLPQDGNWRFVDDTSYDVLVAERANPAATALLKERKEGTMVLEVCGPEERELPGAIRLARPLTRETVASGLRAAQLLTRRPETRKMPTVGSFGGPANSGLQELAANYRFDLARHQNVSITIEGRQFHLFPQKYLYLSDSSPRELSLFRGMSSLHIDVNTNGTKELPSSKSANHSGPAPRRLDEFLWHLGHNARPGRLLQWLGDDRAYRLTRWPPVVREGGDSTLVKIGTLMARRTLRPVEVSLATGNDIERISDFLNGCTLVGCLESMRASDAPVPRGGTAKNPAFASLLGRIRVKLGLT
jgi:hypothetical protein